MRYARIAVPRVRVAPSPLQGCRRGAGSRQDRGVSVRVTRGITDACAGEEAGAPLGRGHTSGVIAISPIAMPANTTRIARIARIGMMFGTRRCRIRWWARGDGSESGHRGANGSSTSSSLQLASASTACDEPRRRPREQAPPRVHDAPQSGVHRQHLNGCSRRGNAQRANRAPLRRRRVRSRLVAATVLTGRRSDRRAAWVVAGLPAVPVLVLLVRILRSGWLSSSDWAAIELRTRDVGTWHTPLGRPVLALRVEPPRPAVVLRARRPVSDARFARTRDPRGRVGGECCRDRVRRRDVVAKRTGRRTRARPGRCAAAGARSARDSLSIRGTLT